MAPMTSSERQALLVEVARIELLLEGALSDTQGPMSDRSLSAPSNSFDRAAAIETTHDLIVRAKVAITGRASQV